ncbi:MAG: terminase gpA endonuclease subunit [Planctomycetaceae bacterium]
MPCTIIYRGDVADQMTDRELYPDWQGQREGIVDKLPDNLAAWGDYFEILDQVKTIPDDRPELLETIRAEATAYYLEHRETLDAGCVASWPERKLPWEASAIQHAMNLYKRDESAFFSEYMNAPLDPFATEDDFLTADQIATRFSGYPRGRVPLDCAWLTAFVDVQHRVLYWTVCAWTPTFTGYVIDYGCWPKQNRPTWKAQKAEQTLKQLYPKRSTEAAIYAGLQELTTQLLDNAHQADAGGTLAVNLCLVDAGDNTATVRKAVREAKHAARILPYFGRTITSQMRPISTYKAKAGEVIGDEWIIGPARSGRSTSRQARSDVNHWKTFVHTRLATPVGDRGSLTIYGRPNSRPHTFFARQLTAELRKRDVGDRPTDRWELKPGETENHWLDCVTGCAVAASMCGASITPAITTTAPRKRSKRAAKYFD